MSRRRKPNGGDPRTRAARTARRQHRPPVDFIPQYVEGDPAKLAAEVGGTAADFLASLEKFEAARHCVRLATDDPSIVRFWAVLPEQYDRIREAADFLESPAGAELLRWVDAWNSDPDLDAEKRALLEAIAAGVVMGNGTYVTEEGVFTIGAAGIEDAYMMSYPAGIPTASDGGDRG